MSAARASVFVASLVATSSLVHAQPQVMAPPAPGAPPRLLNIVLVRLKHKAAGSYGALETSIVRAYERSKVKVYWLGLQASKDADDVLYLNLYDSQESVDRVTVAYQEAVKLHPELSRMQQQLAELTASHTSVMTMRRDDVDQPVGRPNFATMRALRLTIFQVKPGREGDFVTAIRTTKAKDRSWLLYEATETSTFALITLMAGTKSDRHDGPAIPRGVRRFKGVYTKADTRIYAVRPALSHVSQSFAAANPQFWRAASVATH